MTHPRPSKYMRGTLKYSFYLANRDINGNATTGLTRTQTTKDKFLTSSNEIMSTSTGGKNGWDKTKFLNIWISGPQLEGSDGGLVQGYGVFPNNGGNGIAVRTQYLNTPLHLPTPLSIPRTINNNNTCKVTFSLYNYSSFYRTVVYPNPASNDFSIEAVVIADMNLVESYSKKANILSRKSFTQNKINFDTEKLPNGTYFLHIGSGESKIMKQIQVQH
ncbi:T9SS type A sorting domain-containing protein [Dyadobacter chenwenxiniae]|uniref:T9SS type A sorting domain-containing protein n=1 Tax=Dyadobacter chenwenxiniae TaxID=2906456 RepID=A0A9X1TIH7_9BACT|nr:T9SS type A sorting domain-containing protein [Dyadobacter chenwenxiniae]MCF0065860.1 T9SS type A sorting domain-containing protein [Dyadobacter chenwenxiniae]UON84100.1 T9SS type A sorting domain-containing protein [Dyadobacter chenwenxiniae]